MIKIKFPINFSLKLVYELEDSLMASRFTDIKEHFWAGTKSQSWWSANCLYLSLPHFSQFSESEKRQISERSFDEHLRVGLRKDVDFSHRISRKIRGHVTITGYLFIESLYTEYLKTGLLLILLSRKEGS